MPYKNKADKNRNERERYANNPEWRAKVLARNRSYHDPIKKHDQHLRRAYGITLKEHDSMLNEQHGVCAICGEFRVNKRFKRMHVDHCHKTKKVRGILCFSCNQNLGWYETTGKNKIEAYLNKHED